MQFWVIMCIRGYQKGISPLLGPRCRFYPSCSEYAVMAVKQHGAVKGCWLGFKRIIKCHPGNEGGIDYPPGCQQPKINK